MSLAQTIDKDFVEAMKAKDDARVRTLRSLKTALKNAQINAKGAELDEQAMQSVIGKEAKQRKESIESFESAGRDELAAREKEELAILQTYLPEPMSNEEIIVIIDEAIAQTGASGSADMGKVMGVVSGKTKGKADGGHVAQLVKEKLSS